MNSSLKPSNRDRSGRSVETWRVNRPEHLLPLPGLVHHLTLRPCRGSVSKATAACGSGALPVSVNVVRAVRAALISKRAEATFLHRSAGLLPLVVSGVSPYNLHAKHHRGGQIRGLLPLQRSHPGVALVSQKVV